MNLPTISAQDVNEACAFILRANLDTIRATCPRPELIPALERLTRRRCAQARADLLAALADNILSPGDDGPPYPIKNPASVDALNRAESTGNSSNNIKAESPPLSKPGHRAAVEKFAPEKNGGAQP